MRQMGFHEFFLLIGAINYSASIIKCLLESVAYPPQIEMVVTLGVFQDKVSIDLQLGA